MPNAANVADRNLLFGILALQMDFITRDQLVAGMNAWVLEKAKPLGQVLAAMKHLAEDERALLDALVEKHLAKHQHDPQQSIAALGSSGALAVLKVVADAEVQASVAYLRSVMPPSGPEADAKRRGADVPTHSWSAGPAAGDRFRFLRPHAEGGLGKVSVALDEELNREVALKEIKGRHADNVDSRGRFLLEAEITGGLEHPGIVPVYSLGTYADGRPFYAMRFIKGDSLQDAIERFHGDRQGDMSLEFRQLLGRFVDVCNAIAYAHSRGVLHRDLKPGNIMLGKYGETLVVDWGLAKPGFRREGGTPRTDSQALTIEPTLNPSSGSSATLAGAAMGTPQFMSPEQAAGRPDLLGPASDVYSLGATLYNLLTGRTPFHAANPGVLLANVQLGEFPPPRRVKPDVAPALEAICLKALALRPEQRYASALDLAADIEHWLADEPVSAYREPWSARAGRWARKHKPLVSGMAAAALVAIVALTGGCIWYGSHRAEVARKQALTEQAALQALEQAQAAHDRLQTDLRNPGGVQALLNHPGRWEVQLQTARANWQRAQALVANADSNLGQQLMTSLQQVDGALKGDQGDYELAVRLEAIRLDRAVAAGRILDFPKTASSYQRAFQDAGLTVEAAGVDSVAQRITKSAIKEQLLAALDDWAFVSYRSNKQELCAQVSAVARAADPDPWRDQARDVKSWRDGAAMVKLADAVRNDKEQFARLSPQMLSLIQEVLPRASVEPWLKKAVVLHPADFWLNFDMGTFLVLTKDRKAEATAYFRVALAIRPNSAVVYNNLAAALREAGDLPAANDALDMALSLDRQCMYAWYNLGVVRYDQKQWPAALEATRKALDLDANYIDGWLHLGAIQMAQKNYEESQAAYEKALAISPNHAVAWLGLGSTRRYRNDLPRAVAAYEKAVKFDPKSELAWLNLGFVLRKQDKLPEAIDALNQNLALNPRSVETLANLGRTYAAQKNIPAAIGAFRKALDIDPRSDQAWEGLGVALFYQPDYPAAVDAFKKALAIDPRFVGAWTHLGMTHLQQKKHDEAIDAFQEALAIDTNDARVWSLIEKTLRELKDPATAVGACRKILAISPERAQVWYDLGWTLHRQKNLPEAVEAYRKVISLNPKHIDAWINLGNALDDQNDRAAAIDAYRKGLALFPQNTNGWYNLGIALGRHKDLAAARDALRQAVALDPKYAKAWTSLGSVLRGQKEFVEAADAYGKGMALQPDLATKQRIYAAGCAALAADGKGADADKLSAKEKENLRHKALAWLQEDLAAQRELIQSTNAAAAAPGRRALAQWQSSADLASVRDAASLAMLPRLERELWQSLWTDVRQLLAEPPAKN